MSVAGYRLPYAGDILPAFRNTFHFAESPRRVIRRAVLKDENGSDYDAGFHNPCIYGQFGK